MKVANVVYPAGLVLGFGGTLAAVVGMAFHTPLLLNAGFAVAFFAVFVIDLTKSAGESMRVAAALVGLSGTVAAFAGAVGSQPFLGDGGVAVAFAAVFLCELASRTPKST